MNSLTPTESLKILKFVQEINTLCSLKEFPTRVVWALPEAIAGEVPCYQRLNFQTRTLSEVYAPALKSIDYEQTAHEYFYQHPRIAHFLHTGDGGAYKISDFLSQSQLYRLEGLYDKFLHLIGAEDQMAIALPMVKAQHWSESDLTPEDSVIAITIHRDQRNFCESERFVFNLLRPHLIQAYQNAKSFTQMQHDLAQSNQAMELLGLVILSHNGQVQSMTKKAWSLLGQYFPVPLLGVRCLPTNLQAWVKYQLSRLGSERNIGSPCLPLQMQREGKQLSIRLLASAGDQHLLLLSEQQTHSLSVELLELLGLNQREAEVLLGIFQGKSNQEIAATTQLSCGTVKKYIEYIYQKLEVQSRVAAVTCAWDRLGMISNINSLI